MKKSEKIREIVSKTPELRNFEVARIVGCTPALVSQIRGRTGFNERARWVRSSAAAEMGIDTHDLDKKILQVIYEDDLVRAILEE